MKMLLCDGSDVDLIKHLSVKFIDEAQEFFGKGFLSYNSHGPLHLCEDYKQWGNLEKVSCFPFETYLGSHIKDAVRSGHKPLQQIYTHVGNLNSVVPQKNLRN